MKRNKAKSSAPVEDAFGFALVPPPTPPECSCRMEQLIVEPFVLRDSVMVLTVFLVAHQKGIDVQENSRDCAHATVCEMNGMLWAHMRVTDGITPSVERHRLHKTRALRHWPKRMLQCRTFLLSISSLERHRHVKASRRGASMGFCLARAWEVLLRLYFRVPVALEQRSGV